MCYYHQHACLLVCLSVSQTSMDDSGHKENTGRLLNSRTLGVLQVITLFMTKVSVCQSKFVCQSYAKII